jgi:hypothetical protein
MKAALKSVARRKLSRRAPAPTVLQRLSKLEAAVFPSSMPARAAAPDPRFVNLDLHGRPTTGRAWAAAFDRETGLVWMAAPLKGGEDMTHADGIKACAELDFLGVKKWRMPTVKELVSIVDYERCDPAVDPGHFGGPFGATWSSTIAKSPAGYAWFVYLGYGFVNRYYQGFRLHVRAVCAGELLGLSA